MANSRAFFAAGCFWGVQYYFDQIPGVDSTIVGYIGGETDNPTYEDVCYKNTAHAEAIEITYDPNKLSYDTLVKHFFRMHDPTQLNRQGPDVGDQYRSAIFYADVTQKDQAQKIKDELNKKSFNDKIETQIVPATTFWPAEDYHQKYTEKTGRGMCHIEYSPI